jgi:hypothetical protein
MARLPPKDSGAHPLRELNVPFFTPVETYCIMEAARSTDYGAALALVLFAGVKKEVLVCEHSTPLSWKNIDFSARTIFISKALNRGKPAFLIDCAPKNLWRWLEWERKDQGPVFSRSLRELDHFVQKQIKRTIPINALRDSFAIHHLALWKNLKTTARLLGYQGRLSILQRDCSDLTTREGAIEYFDIYPDAPDILD